MHLVSGLNSAAGPLATPLLLKALSLSTQSRQRGIGGRQQGVHSQQSTGWFCPGSSGVAGIGGGVMFP